MNLLLKIQQILNNLSKTLATLIKIIILSKCTHINKLKPKNPELVILGNGPSFKSMYEKNADFLNGKDLICVNHFPSTELYQKLKPKYFITAAPDLYDENVEEEFRIRGEKLFKTIAEKTTWELDFIITTYAKKFKQWQNIIAQNKNIKVKFINTTPVEGFKNINHLLFRLNLGMPRPHNILIPSIFLGINAKYKTIYLWGADHSWLPEISVNDDNIPLVNQKHFYDSNSSKPKAFSQNGIGIKKLHEILKKFMLAFESYFVLKEYAESNKTKILNCTPNSFIDAFERLKL